jgi:type I restriction enzyme S subunit
MTFGLEQHIIDKIISVFEANAKVDKAYIFGSRAKGNYRPDSDIDIAIKGIDITLNDILKMSVAFEDKGIKNKIDLVDYTTIKEPALQEHIDRVGIEFYSRWNEYKLDEAYDFASGLSKGAEEFGFGYDFLAFKDIFQNFFVPKTLTSLVNSTEKERKSCSIQRGDVFLTRTSETDEDLGMSCVALKDYPNATFNGFTKRLRPNSKIEIYPEYAGFYFRTPKFRAIVSGMSSVTTRASLNNSMLAQLTIAIPPINEQEVIANTLIALHNKIDLLQRQNRTLEQLAETLFRQWFVVEAKESWEEKSLVEIADFLNGLALQKFPAKGNDFLPVIKIREMKQGISENTDKCSSNIPTQYIVMEGDVLFSWSGSLEVVLWTGGEGALNQHLFKVTSNNYPQWFYYLATKYHLNDFKAIAESKSTTMGHIQREHLKQAMISIPPKQMFEEYDLRISHLIDKLIDNNKQISTLTQTRDTLLPKLMSGEIRITL